MINFNTEYYSNNYYFFLKERADKISLYYSIADTLTESRKNDERIDFDKKDSKKVKNIVGNVLKSKTKVSKDALTKKLKSIKPKKEIDELVDSDGTMLSSKIPFLNQTLTPHKTTDQTVAMARITNDPVTRGYRVYYGESVVREIDARGAFGFEETELEGEDAKEAIETFKELGVDDPKGRAKEMGYDPKLEKKKLPGSFTRKRLEEVQKQKMIKVLEDMVTKKSKDTDVQNKEINASKLLIKNLKTLKKMAEKEGLSNSDILKLLKNE